MHSMEREGISFTEPSRAWEERGEEQAEGEELGQVQGRIRGRGAN